MHGRNRKAKCDNDKADCDKHEEDKRDADIAPSNLKSSLIVIFYLDDFCRNTYSDLFGCLTINL